MIDMLDLGLEERIATPSDIPSQLEKKVGIQLKLLVHGLPLLVEVTSWHGMKQTLNVWVAEESSIKYGFILRIRSSPGSKRDKQPWIQSRLPPRDSDRIKVVFYLDLLRLTLLCHLLSPFLSMQLYLLLLEPLAKDCQGDQGKHAGRTY